VTFEEIEEAHSSSKRRFEPGSPPLEEEIGDSNTAGYA
jgi:hypothetical protein